jgi:hypothetical protein
VLLNSSATIKTKYLILQEHSTQDEEYDTDLAEVFKMRILLDFCKYA